MFGLGMMEIGLIIVLAVMLFPPKELPKLARMVARVYGQVRKTAEDFRSAVLDDEDLREPIEEIKGAYNDARFEIRDAERRARQQLAKAQMEMRMATARRIQADREAKAKAEAEAAATGEAGEGEGGETPVEAANDGSEHGAHGAEHGHSTLPAPTAGTPVPAASVPKIARDEAGRDGPEPSAAAATAPTSPTGAVAGSDPRVIAARRSGAYTPRAEEPAAETPDPWSPSPGAPASDDEPREGVA